MNRDEEMVNKDYKDLTKEIEKNMDKMDLDKYDEEEGITL